MGYEHKSVILSQTNTGDVTIPIGIDRTFGSPILTEAKQHNVSVTRLSVPTSTIQVLRFADRSKYAVGFRAHAAPLGLTKTYTEQLPNFDSHRVQYDTLPGAVEYINRAFCKAFTSFLEDHADTDIYPTTDPKAAVAFTQAAPTNSQTVSTSAVRVALAELQVDSITYGSAADDSHVELFIESPDGIRVAVFSGTVAELKTIPLPARFSEHSYTDRANFVPTTDTSITRPMKSHQTMWALQPATPAGSWDVGIDCSQATWSITMSYTLHNFFADGLYVPSQSPYLSISSDDKLRLSMQSLYRERNYRIHISPYLKSSFTFYQCERRLVPATGMYEINYPAALPGSDVFAVTTLSQQASTLRRISNLVGIELHSATLSGAGESIIATGSDAAISSSVIQDFTVDRDVDLGTQLVFTLGAIPYRQASMRHASDLINRIDLQVFAKYADDSTHRVNLHPGDRFDCRVSFIRY